MDLKNYISCELYEEAVGYLYGYTLAFGMPLNTDPISGPLTLFILMEHLIHISTIGSMVWVSPFCD